MKKVMLMSVLMCGLVITTTIGHAEEASREASVNLTESDEASGLLKITEASELNFGSQEIGIEDMLFKDESGPKLVITDLHGNAPGWHVSVALGEFEDEVQGLALKGVKLFYPTVSMTTNATVNVTERMPATTASNDSFSKEAKGLVIDAAAESAGKVLVNAAVGKGNGQWTATYDAGNEVELLVPSGNLAGNYVADLTYTLTDGPEAE